MDRADFVAAGKHDGEIVFMVNPFADICRVQMSRTPGLSRLLCLLSDRILSLANEAVNPSILQGRPVDVLMSAGCLSQGASSRTIRV